MKDRPGRLHGVFLVLLALLALRLVQFQVLQGARHSLLSDRNHIRKVVLPGPRGRVFDRTGLLVADTRPSFTVSVIPTEMTDSTLPLLASLLELPVEELTESVRPVSYMSVPIRVQRDISHEQLFRIETNLFRLAGVRTSVDPVRSYPYGRRYCHVLGHIGRTHAEDMARDTSYRALDYIGRDGVELRYERHLRGRDGSEYVEVDVHGHEIGPLPEKRSVPAVAGKDLHLTLDPHLHQQAHWLTSDYARAAIVILDVRTGGVLCLYSRPGFDPNLFASPMPTGTWERLLGDPAKPFFNRALSAAYPPGSVFKPFVALAALESNTARISTRYKPCLGSYRYGDRSFRCWKRHGSLDLADAIAHSCNVYFYQLGLKLGLDSLSSFCRSLPLGRRTGIDLPMEHDGIVPSRAWLDNHYGTGKWQSGILLNLSIGQGEILTTPLQIALSYAAIAGDGEYLEPYVVARIDSAGRPVYHARPRRRRIRADIANLSQIRQALEHVVEYGTARTARLKEVTIAGKTGTAQNPGGIDHAWFVGYAPADCPEIVIAVIVENAGHGGVVAAPIAGRLFRTWFLERREPSPGQ